MKCSNLLLIEDQHLVRESLSLLLESTGQFKVVAAVAGIADARGVLHNNHDIDLILCDFNLRNETAYDLLKQQSITQQIPIVILTSAFNGVKVQQSISLGARGFLFKESDTSEFIHALTLIIKGDSYFPQPSSSSQLDFGQQDTHPDLELTPSELEILSWLATGMSNKQIAITLHKSSETVKTQVARILFKLKCENRTQAVSKASQLNLL